MKKSIIILTAIAVFCVSLLRIAPIVYKHYPPATLYENLALGRNLAVGDGYKIESEKNVFLSSSLAGKEGVESDLGNKLTPVLYSWLYKLYAKIGNIFGAPEIVVPSYASIFLFACSGVFLFLCAGLLFGYWPAVIFSIFYAFMPVVWKSSLVFGGYEFAFFFFSLGLLLYFCGVKKGRNSHEQEIATSSRPDGTPRNDIAYLFFSAILFSLAVLSRNAFLFSVLPIFIFDFWKNKSFKKSAFLILPFVLVVGGFFISDAMKANSNYYLSSKEESFTTYGHLFPDPYTYFFEKGSYLQSIKNSTDPDVSEFLVKYGYGTSLKNQILMYWNSFVFYPINLFSITLFGGPFIIFLAIFGAVWLWRERKDLFGFFAFWLVFWYGSLVLLKTNNWDHFLEISFVVVLLAALGVWRLIDAVKNFKLFTEKRAGFIAVLFVIFVFLQIFMADKWMFHEAYNSSSLEQNPTMIEAIKKVDLKDSDVVAVGIHQGVPELLNYYTDKNFIYFAPETMEKLANENKTKEAFDFFGVTKIFGYDEKVSAEIQKQTGVGEISMSSL